MGFREALEEAARQDATGDTAFVSVRPYVLELRSPALEQGAVLYALPAAPEMYRAVRRPRSAKTPTLGGIVLENRGRLWVEIEVSGTFGWRPKPSFDSTTQPLPRVTAPLSGLEWSRRLMRNVIDEYLRLRSDPAYAAETFLIWHDSRTDDHWQVEVDEAGIARTKDRRLQDPWELKLTGVADADAIPLDLVQAADQRSRYEQARDEVRQALALADSVLAEVSLIVGDLRSQLRGIQSVVDDITGIVAGARDVVAGTVAVFEIPRNTVTAAADALAEVLALAEDITTIPHDVVYQFSLLEEALDAMAAQRSLFQTTYGGEAAGMNAVSSGAATATDEELAAAAAAGPPSNVRDVGLEPLTSTDADLRRAGLSPQGLDVRPYAGSQAYTVREGDTLEALAARFLGDASRWVDIAVQNALREPYLSAVGLEGTAAPGDVILIPAVSAGEGRVNIPSEDLDADLYGVDLLLEETGDGLDWVIDPRSLQDAMLLGGTGNLVQALQARLWTVLGSVVSAPSYGLRDLIGSQNTEADAALLRINLRTALLQDSRVERVQEARFTLVDDRVELETVVVPVGGTRSGVNIRLIPRQ